MKKSAKGIVCLGFYIDDNLIIENSKAIDEVVEQLKKMDWY